MHFANFLFIYIIEYKKEYKIVAIAVLDLKKFLFEIQFIHFNLFIANRIALLAILSLMFSYKK